MMYYIKGCHRCSKHGSCSHKGDPILLLRSPKVIEVPSKGKIASLRGFKHRIVSFCKDFEMN